MLTGRYGWPLSYGDAPLELGAKAAFLHVALDLLNPLRKTANSACSQ